MQEHLLWNERRGWVYDLLVTYGFNIMKPVHSTNVDSRRDLMRSLFKKVPRVDIGTFDTLLHEVQQGICLILQNEGWPHVSRLLFDLVVEAAMWETWRKFRLYHPPESLLTCSVDGPDDVRYPWLDIGIESYGYLDDYTDGICDFYNEWLATRPPPPAVPDFKLREAL